MAGVNPVVLIGGYLGRPTTYEAMATRLSGPLYGRRCFIVPFAAWRWALIRDWSYSAIVDAVAETVARARAETGAERVTIIAHSAGGRAARLYLGDQPYRGTVHDGQRHVDQLITLGTPHGGIEQYAARLTQWLNDTYPGAYWPHIRYVSVIGRSVIGDPHGTLQQRRVYRSYRVQTGDGVEWGDGVVPLACAYLPGAEHLILPGITHFPHDPHFYGSVKAMAQWGRYLRDETPSNHQTHAVTVGRAIPTAAAIRQGSA